MGLKLFLPRLKLSFTCPTQRLTPKLLQERRPCRTLMQTAPGSPSHTPSQTETYNQ